MRDTAQTEDLPADVSLLFRRHAPFGHFGIVFGAWVNSGILHSTREGATEILV